MLIRAIPQRHLAYVEGAIQRALAEIASGKAPDFMDDSHLKGTAFIAIRVVEASAGAVPAGVEAPLRQTA